MKINDLKRPTLRNRDILEEQLAAEIALGALESLDRAIENQHEVALEYGAQLLFNHIRCKVARQKNLPVHIACYLFFDRTPEVRYEIISRNFYSLPEDYQEAFLEETITKLNAMQDPYPYTYDKYQPWYILENIRNSAITKDDDKLVARLTSVKHVVASPTECVPSQNLEKLRKFPETVRICYDIQLHHVQANTSFTTKTLYTPVLALAHPDESIRLQAVKDLVNLSAHDLRRRFSYYRNLAQEETGNPHRKGDIKKIIYPVIADDPSLQIRTFLVNNIRHASALQIIADKYKLLNPELAKVAEKKYEQIQKRTEYAMNYQKRKQTKGR